VTRPGRRVASEAKRLGQAPSTNTLGTSASCPVRQRPTFALEVQQLWLDGPRCVLKARLVRLVPIRFQSVGSWLIGSSIALSSLLANGSAFADSFRKHPYLQGLGRDRVQIRFELHAEAPATVEVTGPNGWRKELAMPESRELHEVHIRELLPATSYRYEVRSGELVAGGTFTTAPDDSRPFSFLVYGDSRSNHAAHAGVVRRMLDVPSDFLVGTGDMTARGDQPGDWDAFFFVERKLLADRCLFTAIGNHELIGVGREGRSPFLEYFATGVDSGERRLYDTFRWSNARFFILSAMEDWTGPEREWLARELAKADDEPGLEHRFAVLHIGPWTSGPHGPNRRMHEAGIPDLFRKHGVDLVFSGHDHLYERGEANGIKYMVSGGAGAPLYRVKNLLPTTGKAESTHHFIEVKVDGPDVRTRAIRMDGSLIESCSYRKGEPWSCDGPGEARSIEKLVPAATAVAAAGSSSCICSAPGSTSPRGKGTAATIAFVAGLAFSLRRRSWTRRAAL